MKKIIHDLRQKPEEVRRRVLHVATGVCALVLISLWIYSLGVRMSGEPEVETAAGPSPISALKANFIDGYKSIGQ